MAELPVPRSRPPAEHRPPRDWFGDPLFWRHLWTGAILGFVAASFVQLMLWCLGVMR
jgi:hypothetical protein